MDQSWQEDERIDDIVIWKRRNMLGQWIYWATEADDPPPVNYAGCSLKAELLKTKGIL